MTLKVLEGNVEEPLIVANDMREVIKAVSTVYDRDPAHSARVTSLALTMFDELNAMHNLGASERLLLEMAGIMHDIGYSLDPSKPHNKLSRDLILGTDLPGLTDDEKLTCALVARYHTGELPDASQHRHFALLSEDRREVVEWLAGILRVADALDNKHVDVVKRLLLDVDERAITLTLDVSGDCRRQIKRAREKEALLVRKSGRSIKYIC